MQSQIVLSTLGPDKPGIVEAVSRSVSQFNLNIDKSRMSIMGSEFSLVSLLSGNKIDIETFLNSADELFEDLNLDWVVRTAGETTGTQSPSLPFILSVAAIDTIGLVARVTKILQEASVNIQDLETSTRPAAESGTPVFHLSALISVPQSTRLESLKQSLFDIADELNCDLSVEPA